jgi:hypothetical protein
VGADWRGRRPVGFRPVVLAITGLPAVAIMSQRHRVILALSMAVVMLIAVSVYHNGRGGTRLAIRPQPSVPAPFVRGDYGNPVMTRDARGVRRIDIKDTVERLRAAHVNSYAYLISPGPSSSAALSQASWEDLPSFAEVAGEAKIAVYVYLVPPSGAKELEYLPFHWDYARWVTEIARIASRHPSVRGVILDDLSLNAARRPNVKFFFTPQYIGNMMREARRVAPWLTFTPVLYYADIIGPRAILPLFRDVIDGVIYPYTQPLSDEDASTMLIAKTRRIAGITRCPTSRRCALLDFPAATSRADMPPAASRSFRVVSRSTDGSYVEIQINDDAEPSAGAPYLVQALVDGKVVAQLGGPAGGWNNFRLPVPAGVSQGSLFDVRIVKNSDVAAAVSVAVGDITFHGLTVRDPFGAEGFTVNSPTVLISGAGGLPAILMIYTSPFGRFAPPVTGTDISTALLAAQVLKNEGSISGLMTYLLNLTGAAGTPAAAEGYALVRGLYAGWDSK